MLFEDFKIENSIKIDFSNIKNNKIFIIFLQQFIEKFTFIHDQI